MRSRDYECWMVDVTPCEEGLVPMRLEEGAVPLVRKLSDTSRNARAAMVLQAGRKYVLQWRRTAICDTTEAEAADPFVTCVWVNIALNGKTLGEGLLSDLNPQTRASLDGVTSSTALTGSPLWEDKDGAPAGLVGKLSVSFYRSPEVIRRALKDRAYSEPQSPQSLGVDQGAKSASVVRRSPLFFRGAANPAPTVFNFFFEVAADAEKTLKATPQSLRRSVSTNFENILSWSKAKGKKVLQQTSDDGLPVSSTPVAAVASLVGGTLEEEEDVSKDKATPVSMPHQAEATPVLGRPRAATLLAINGRLVVVPDPNQGSQNPNSSTVDTDYVLRGRPRAATMAARLVPSQPASGMTCASTFLSAVSAFQGESIVATRPRRALSDAPAQWLARVGAAQGSVFEAVQGKSEEAPISSSNVSPKSLTSVAEADWESTRGLAVAYRDSLHQDLAGGQISKLAVLDSDSDSSSLAESPRLGQDALNESVVHPALRYAYPERMYAITDHKAVAANVTGLNLGNTIDTQTTKASFARSVGNGRIDIAVDTADSSYDHAVLAHSAPFSQPLALGEITGAAVAPAMPSPARLQVYEAKRAAIAPLEDTLRALQEEEANLLHMLEVRRLNEYQDSLSRQIEERRLHVDMLEQELNHKSTDGSKLDATPGDQGSIASFSTPSSPARSLTSFLVSAKEPLEAVSAGHSNQPSNDSLVLARHQLASAALSTAYSESHPVAVMDSSEASSRSSSFPSRPRAGSLRQAFVADESRPNTLSFTDMVTVATPFSPRSAEGALPVSLPLTAATSSSGSGWQSAPRLGLASSASTVDVGVVPLKPSDFSLSSHRALRASGM